MSLNSRETIGMNETIAVSSNTQGPRLQNGSVGYATWKPTMDVYLQRNGAEGIHRKPMTTDRWMAMNIQVETWASEELEAAMLLLDSKFSDSSSTSNSSSKTTQKEESTVTTVSVQMEKAKKTVTLTVERSHRVYGILFSSIPVELRAQTAHIPRGFSHGLWLWLETKYQSTEEDHVGELLESWSIMHQEANESFDAYRARVNELSELLKTANETPSARMYVHTLLGRLQPVYKQAVLALKVGDKLKDAKNINWDAVSALINTHERDQLRLNDGSAVSVSQAMAANNRSFGQRIHNGTQSKSETISKTHTGEDKRECFNCGKVGHIQRFCRSKKLHQKSHGPNIESRGLLPSHPSTSGTGNSKGSASAAVVQEKFVSETSSSAIAHTAFAVTYAAAVSQGLVQPHPRRPIQRVNQTPDQLFQTVLTVPAKFDDNDLASTSVAKQPLQISMSAARPIISVPCEKQANSLDSMSNKSGFTKEVVLIGIDSMASIHLSGDRNIFTHLRRCLPMSVTVADRNIVTSTECGTMNVRIKTSAGKITIFPIHNVYYHERFAANLLSLSLLTDSGWKFNADKEKTILTTPGGNSIRLSTRGKVSILEGDGSVQNNTHDQGIVYNVEQLLSVKVKTVMELHCKLGHMPFARMMRLIKSGSTLDVDKLYTDNQVMLQAEKAIKECKACCEGKTTRSWLGHRGLDKGNAPLEALHMDTYFIQLSNGDRIWQEYGVPLSDPYSGWRYHNYATSKDEIANGVIASVEHAKKQFNRNIKRLYTDGGTEFINRTLKEYCTKNGIELRYSPARTPQLNGVAEQSVRSCKDAVRTLLAHGRVPWRFWSYAAGHATFLWNRTHVHSKTGLTPYEVLYGKAPSAKHWGVFGCDAYVHVPKEHRSALAPKAEPCIYLGHNGHQNCANLYILRTKKIISSRDVTYRNDSFTFSHAVCEGENATRLAVEQASEEANNVQWKSSIESDDQDQQSHHDQNSGSDVRDTNHDHSSSLSSSSRPGESDEPTAQKWELQSIAGQRWYGRNKQHQFKCIWTGNYESTWEPAHQIKLDAPEVVEDFVATLPPLRQSSRHQVAVDTQLNNSALASSKSRDSEDDSDVMLESEPQLHRAMCAVQAMQVPSTISDHHSEEEFHRALVCAVKAGIAKLEQDTPNTYREAINSPDSEKWKVAMHKEITSCLEKEVWDEVHVKDLSPGTNILPVKWVYKIKIDETGTAVIYKARLTPKGFRQKEGVDYFDVFAPTGKYKTERFGLSMTARWDYELEQMDVPTAFLNADLEEDVYMHLPDGYRDGKEGIVLRLKKSLYGLKQAPRNWSIRLKSFIIDILGYTSTVSDPCLFWKRSKTSRLMLLFVFVDDIQTSFHNDDRREWEYSKRNLVKEFNTKDMGPSSWMLGMRITRDRQTRTITLDQEVYITKALEKYGYAECTTRPTPEVVGAASQDPSEEQSQPTDRQRYMEITGTLMYAAISTRPDIAHAVFYLASHMVAPTRMHMAAADRVMRYLAGTRKMGLAFGSRNGGALGDSRGHTRTQVDICAYADADWANSRGDRRSITGWVSKVNGDPISWSSKKQRTVALSTCEAELYAESAAIQEVLWLRGLLKEIGLQSQVGSIVYGDNQSTIAITKNGIKGERTKHVDVKYHFVSETVDRGDVQLKWIPTAEQQADIFTKALPQPIFEKLRSQIMATSSQ